jgi:hypothetical protein
MSKTINIKFNFAPADWADLRRHYTERDIRQILYEGALGELHVLMQNKDALGTDEGSEGTK